MRALLLLLFLACLGCATAPGPSTPPYTISLLGSGPLIVPKGTEIDGLTVGGLSAIAETGGDCYSVLVDNQKGTPARIFSLCLRITPDGPVPPPGKTAVQIPCSALRLAGLDGDTFDGEGLAVTPEGTFLVSSEKEPSIREVSKDGETLRFLPVPARFALVGTGDEPAATGIHRNEGFEALSLSPDGKSLWTANETAIRQDAPDQEAALYGRHPVRLLRYERQARRGQTLTYVPAGELVYIVDPIEHRGTGFKVRGLVDLLPLPEGGFLALEREFVEGVGGEVQIFLVDTKGATDVSSLDTLAVTAWTPVRKTLLFDFGGAGFVPDNLEGMTLGPKLPDGDRTLIVVSDDNFDDKQETQIVALRLRSAH